MNHKPIPYTTNIITKPIVGEVRVPADKSISHRAIILGSLAIGDSRINNLLTGDDVIATINAMRAMGVKIYQQDDAYVVEGNGLFSLTEPNDVINMGNSGTGVRLIAGLVSSLNMLTFFTGDCSLNARPMQRIIEPLRQNGCQIIAREDSLLPMSLRGIKDAIPIEYTLPVASAQVKSAILLAGLHCEGHTIIHEPVATRDHSENMLISMGAKLISANNTITLQGLPSLHAQHITIPADPSSAAFATIAAVLIKGSEIVIRNVGINKHRIGLYNALKQMQANIEFDNIKEVCGEKTADISIKYSELKAINLSSENAPAMIDEYPILSIAAAFAAGTSRFNGLSELRVKECDRLQAIIKGLVACGINAYNEDDDLIIEGMGADHLINSDDTINIESFYDHRIAMSFIIMGLKAKSQLVIDDISAIKTSYPNFIAWISSLA